MATINLPVRGNARSYGGDRVKMSVPADHGPKLWLISAISSEEVLAALYGEWSTDGDIFFEFINRCLVPNLSKGKIVLMDNISFHKAKRVEEAITSTGATLKFLPAYSPDFSPIENMWSKIKTVLREYAPRALEAFKEAIKEAFKSIAKKDLIAWFKHCGYAFKPIRKPL